MSTLNLEWIKCHHGIEKRLRCLKCEEEKNAFKIFVAHGKNEAPKRIPIRRGCNAQGGCFCSGRCQEIIGYRDPLYPGEKE